MSERISDSIDIENSFGIFRMPSEPMSRGGCLVTSIVCFIVTVIILCFTFSHGFHRALGMDILISVIGILVTAASIFFTIIASDPPEPTNKHIFDGVWVSKNKIWMGPHEIEFNENWPNNDKVANGKMQAVKASWKKSESTRCIDVDDALISIQIINSKYDDKDYRLSKIHIYDKKEERIDACITVPPILIINGTMIDANALPLVDQLKKISESFGGILKYKENICKLWITPRNGKVGGLTIAFGLIGALVQTVAEVGKVHSATKALQKAQFVDKETSGFLLELAGKNGWQVEFDLFKLEMLGLANSEW